MPQKDLPGFAERDFEAVKAFVSDVLLDRTTHETSLVDLIAYGDGHFRAIFRPSYFMTPDSKSTPSRSQWSTLKKKLKRHDHQIFVFKDYGMVACANDERCCYIDFGFFRE
ncbi:MAG: hypothetical protein GYB66_01380 [Chloroflexi bacterium]|nr:hypothetical protein [Chloroflexota bacterium]